MRWGFKREDAKLLFNARAESITDVNFWKKSFSLRAALFLPTASSSGRKLSKVRNRNLSSPSEVASRLA
jgi:hypothetical protein